MEAAKAQARTESVRRPARITKCVHRTPLICRTCTRLPSVLLVLLLTLTAALFQACHSVQPPVEHPVLSEVICSAIYEEARHSELSASALSLPSQHLEDAQLVSCTFEIAATEPTAREYVVVAISDTGDPGFATEELVRIETTNCRLSQRCETIDTPTRTVVVYDCSLEIDTYSPGCSPRIAHQALAQADRFLIVVDAIFSPLDVPKAVGLVAAASRVLHSES